jgi:hypothetical protein
MAKKKKEKNEDELKDENDFLKMSLMAEYGGDFIGGSDLPPDVENLFLKQIKDFHKKQSKALPKKIYEIINEPDYDHTADLSDKEIKIKLKKLLKKLADKGIIVSSIMQVPEREMYRFITEDVFKTVVQYAKGTNMLLNIFYEEYFPSDEAEVKILAQDFIVFVFDLTAVFIDHDLFAQNIKNSYNIAMQQEELIAQIERFKAQFKWLSIEDVHFNFIEVNKEQFSAKVIATINYKSRKSDRGRFSNAETELEVEMEMDEEKEIWQISKIRLSELFDNYI